MNAACTDILLTLDPAGRRLEFTKELLDRVDLHRRVGGEPAAWQPVAVNARSPYLDMEAFPPGTELEYYAQHFNPHG